MVMEASFPFQTLYRCVLDDLYAHPALEKEVRELQRLSQLHCRQWVERIMIIYQDELSIKGIGRRFGAQGVQGKFDCDLWAAEGDRASFSARHPRQWIHSEIAE